MKPAAKVTLFLDRVKGFWLILLNQTNLFDFFNYFCPV